ncbi:hypothetical protein H7Y21_03820 [Arenimonas sp.]|nr:hypothetical protein [Candidatus Parcubacteria bacterium]
MKKAFYLLPKTIRRLIVRSIESIALFNTRNKSFQAKPEKKQSGNKINVLIYHINALSFGGTEKNLQMIAKYLDKSKYNVFLMHATQGDKNRHEYLRDTDMRIIPFEYERVETTWPYFIKNMSPLLETIIEEHKIDCIVTATPGQTIYPLINIKSVPIILINIFGSFSMQKNIRKHLCVSETVKKLAARVVNEDMLEVQYNPSERPIPNAEGAKKIRGRFGIKDIDLVFGRIGRADDSIFDPIALLAFEIAIKINPEIHFLIMSPADAAKKLVIENNIPNVHWLEPSYLEEDVWAFHEAIDVLAHFRADGESCGLNIIESMLVGNPILTHKSHIWNAHLEYLDNSFSRYTEKDDYEHYAKNMIEFGEFHKSGKLKEMGQEGKEKGEKLFLIENIIKRYESWINQAVK